MLQCVRAARDSNIGRNSNYGEGSLSWLFSYSPRSWISGENLVTTDSFHVLSNSLFTNYYNIQSSIRRATDSFFKHNIKKYHPSLHPRQYTDSVVDSIHTTRQYTDSVVGTIHTTRQYTDSVVDSIHTTRQYTNPVVGTIHTTRQYTDSVVDSIHTTRQYTDSVVGTIHTTRRYTDSVVATVHTTRQYTDSVVDTTQMSLFTNTKAYNSPGSVINKLYTLWLVFILMITSKTPAHLLTAHPQR
jgi:hypothetical protein